MAGEKIVQDTFIERIAKLIDPSAFEGHERQRRYCLDQGDDEEEAQRAGDHWHREGMDAARDKARRVVAAFADLPPALAEVGARAFWGTVVPSDPKWWERESGKFRENAAKGFASALSETVAAIRYEMQPLAVKTIVLPDISVAAVREGVKSQERRILVPQPPSWVERVKEERDGGWLGVDDDGDSTWFKPPYGVGDRLLCLESWRPRPEYTHKPSADIPPHEVEYRVADGGRLRDGDWRCAADMPAWACRLALVVTEVRVERVQKIVLGDICAQGLARGIYEFKPVTRGFDAWRGYWDELNGPGAWDRNDWVAAYSFTREFMVGGGT